VRLWRTDRPEIEPIEKFLANGGERGKTQGEFRAVPYRPTSGCQKMAAFPLSLVPVPGACCPCVPGLAPLTGVTPSLWMKYDDV